MACRGVHFAIDQEKYEKLLSAGSDDAVIVGGKQLHQGDDYIISIVSPEQVPLVAEALQHVDETTLKNGYEKIEQSNYDGEIGAEDFEYTWEWFKELPSLFSKAATAGRAVVFSVDQ